MGNAKHEERIVSIAKAINGPWLEMPKGSKYTLNEIRDAKWLTLTTQEQSFLLMQARAALTQSMSKLKDPHGNGKTSLAVGVKTPV